MTTQVTRFPEARKATFSPKAALSSLVSPIVWFFTAVADARVAQAQFEIAKTLQYRYPDKTFSEIYTLVQEGKLNELTK